MSLPHSHPSLKKWTADPRALLKFRLIQERLPPPYVPLILRGECYFATRRAGVTMPLYAFDDTMTVWQPLIAEVQRHYLLAHALKQIKATEERQTDASDR